MKEGGREELHKGREGEVLEMLEESEQRKKGLKEGGSREGD